MSFDIANVVTNFDALMVSVEQKVIQEHDAQRITGSDYATVYLGSMQAVLQTALGYETQGKTTEAEVALLEQKKLTEEAQIKNILSDGTVVYDISTGGVQPASPSVSGSPIGGGVLGKQQVLYNKQTDGFDRDAEQKLIKVLNDLYSIEMSVNDLGATVPTENTAAGIDETIKVAKVAIGIPTET